MTADRAAQIIVVGADFRSSSADLRDRLFIDDTDAPAFLAGLAAAGVGECMTMSTCDRVEVQAAVSDPAASVTAIQAALAARAGVAHADVAAQTYCYTGTAALRHIFAVAAGLQSMIVGEPEVLGQLKASHRAAGAATGSRLEAALQASYAAAKQVRSETAISRGAVSLAACAVRVAADVHGDLSRSHALLLGGGDMGALMLQHFRQAGLRHLVTAAGTPARAADLARQHSAAAITYADLTEALVAADIVIAAAGLGRHLITAAMVEAAVLRRRRRPVFLLDAAVPGDIDPAVDDLEDAYRYDLDDLEKVARAGHAEREAAAREAWRIIDAAVDAFVRNDGARRATPAVRRLRGHFEATREAVLNDPSLDAAAATRLLINKLLHVPSSSLREAGDDNTAQQALRLFGLDDDPSQDDPPGDQQ